MAHGLLARSKNSAFENSTTSLFLFLCLWGGSAIVLG
jgi:hypothetical protein